MTKKEIGQVKVASEQAHMCRRLVLQPHSGAMAHPLTGLVPLCAALQGGLGHALTCAMCGTGRHMERIALPYVMRYLITELASMNIKCSLGIKS